MDSISVNSRKHERTNSKSIDDYSNFGFDEKPLDAYRCRANETENESISIGPSENVMPESFTHDIFYEKLSHSQLFPTEKLGFKQREKCNSHQQNILING